MDVIFEPERGIPFSIEVGFFDTVLEIKEKIQKYQNIPISTQALVFNGQVLQDDRDIEQCELLQDSRVQLYIADQDPQSGHDQHSPMVIEDSITPLTNKIKLNIKMPTSSSQTPLLVEMDLNDTVATLKENIQEMQSVQVNRLVLQYSGKELQDNRSLCDYEICDNADIDVFLRPTLLPPRVPRASKGKSKKMIVKVLSMCGTQKIYVEVNPWDNVGKIRKEIEELHKVLGFEVPEEYFFIHKQSVMEEDRSFRWHQVELGDTIEIFRGRVTSGS